MSDDPAHLLFPNDAPKPQQPPAVSAPAVADASKAVSPASPAGPVAATKPDDVAAKLFKDDAVDSNAKAVTEILGGFAASAIGDGDGGERARAIEAAGDGLIADAMASGTDTKELFAVVNVIHELQANSLTEPTAEQAVQRMTEGLEVCRAENIADADLDLGRRFVMEHLEKIAPGTAYTLERTGAGNDIRVIRAVIAEAKRRGFGR
ncbi:hypothetical protein [Bradyrhizobium retamae]|uniref:Uncharacterized protein n=1 Tax=Bradyrhizobium retamae TaxID=1300035 RepID=A0A0R3NBU0_9BRAD|nr:hypothetical protein [Bradyrhizobium retamae]KRR27501.1 hypothetical protein CQ13_03625 [Bradyrhizobium retamae]